MSKRCWGLNVPLHESLWRKNRRSETGRVASFAKYGQEEVVLQYSGLAVYASLTNERPNTNLQGKGVAPANAEHS